MPMGTQQNNTILHLTMDTWKDQVYVNGEAGLAGHFAVDVLNTSVDAMEKLIRNTSELMELSVDLRFADRESFARQLPRAKNLVTTTLDALWQFPPFSLFDRAIENKTIETIFTEHALDVLMDERSKVRELFFRYLLACTCTPIAIFRFGWACEYLVEHYLQRLKKRDETHFAVAVHDCFNSKEFWDEMSTLPMPELEPFTVTPELSSSYVFARDPRDQKELVFVSRNGFRTAMNFYVYDLLNGMHHGHAPSRCQNCGRYFLTTNAHTPKYCNGNDPERPAYTCRQMGAKKHQSESNDDHPIYELYRTRASTIRKHHERGKIDQEIRKLALEQAAVYRDRALMDRTYADGGYIKDMEPERIYAVVRKEHKVVR